jgi:hypothetical protein
MSVTINRLYGGISDSKMLEDAQTMHDLFSADLADFTAFDPDFDTIFRDDLQSKIDAGTAFPTDETIQDQIQQLTDTVNEKWNLCKEKFQDSKFFIEKAFPGKKTIWNEFGFDDYDEMSTDQSKVSEFMQQFLAAATKYTTQLLAVNYTQLKIDQIAPIGQAFMDANGLQNLAIKERPTTTQNRIITYNNVWKVLQVISKASKVIYKDNPAKYAAYLLPGASNNTAESYALKGKATNKITQAPIENVTVQLPAHGLDTQTDANGNFGFPINTPAGNTPLKAIKVGYTDLNTNATIVEGETTDLDIELDPIP